MKLYLSNINHSIIHASWHLPPHLPTFLAFPPPRNLSRPKRHKSSPRTCRPPSDVVPNGPDPPVTWREDKAYLQEANGGRFGTGDQRGGGGLKNKEMVGPGVGIFPANFFIRVCWFLVVSFRSGCAFLLREGGGVLMLIRSDDDT